MLTDIIHFLVKKIKDSFFIFLIFISLIYDICYFIIKYNAFQVYTTNKELFNDLLGVCNALLISGFYGAITKSLEFNGIYQRVIEKILFSESFRARLQESLSKFVYSVDFLKSQKNIKDIWETTTVSLFENEFPDISKKACDKVYEAVFNYRDITHYYKNYKVFYTLSLIENTYVKIEEYSEYTIVRNNRSPFIYGFKYFLLKQNPEDGRTNIDFEEVTINGRKRKIDECESEEIDQENNVIKKFETELRGDYQYIITVRTRLLQNIDFDNEFIYTTERFTEDMHVEINIPDNFKIIFSSLGTNDFQKISTFNQRLVYTYRGILLPDRGFRLFFIK